LSATQVFAAESAAGATPPPKVLVIATVSTIAGIQQDPNDPDLYRAGSLASDEILASVPDIRRYARVETLQISNVPSASIMPRSGSTSRAA
jgi:L-asparaginase/Glu-tRNA(Gln) amidotransferase subunit D